MLGACDSESPCGGQRQVDMIQVAAVQRGSAAVQDGSGHCSAASCVAGDRTGLPDARRGETILGEVREGLHLDLATHAMWSADYAYDDQFRRSSCWAQWARFGFGALRG